MAQLPLPIPEELNKSNTFQEDIIRNLGIMKDMFERYFKSQTGKASPDSETGRETRQSGMDSMLEKLGTDIKEDTKEKKESNSSLKVFLGKMSDNLDKIYESTKTGLSNTFKFAASALIGPFRLLTKPIEDIFGFDLLESLNPFSEKNKFKGAITDNKIKEIDPGAYYLAKTLGGEKDKKKTEEFAGMLGKLGITGNMAKALALAPGIAMLAGGLIWMTIDAIMGVMKAKQWGTDKLSAGIAGALGGTGSGFTGAFKNMGKWALLGAGTGWLIGGPVGALAGGLIGAAIGAVLGFIGGEYIAKATQKNLTDPLKKLWADKQGNLISKLAGSVSIIIDATIKGVIDFVATVPTMIFSIFEKDKNKQGKFKEGVKSILNILYAINPITFIKNYFLSISEAFHKFKDSKDDKSLVTRITVFALDMLFLPLKTIGKTFQGLFKSIFDNKIMDLKEIGKDMFSKEAFFGILKNIAGVATTLISSVWNEIKENPFKGFIKDIIEGFSQFFEPIINYIKFAGTVIANNPLTGLGILAKDIATGNKGFEAYSSLSDFSKSGRLEDIKTQASKEDLANITRLEKDKGDVEAFQKLNSLLEKLDKTMDKKGNTYNEIKLGRSPNSKEHRY